MIEKINALLKIEERRNQIQAIWKIEPQSPDWRGLFYANHLAVQEKWGVMTSYLSAILMVPSLAATFINPEVGCWALGADVAVGTIGWMRSRQAITAVQQEQAARHL